MKLNRRTQTIGCLIGIIVILIPIIGGAIYAFRAQPSPIEQAQEQSAQILITLARPLNNTHYPVNSVIPVSAQITGAEDSAAIEFWVDGALMETQSPPRGQSSFTARWQWVPAAEGSHVLLARAVSARGQTSSSNLVRVTATPPSNPSIQVQAAGGDTLAGLAEKYGVAPEEITPARWNEESQVWSVGPAPAGVSMAETGLDETSPGVTAPVDPSAPLQAGQPVLIPVNLSPQPSTPRYVPPTQGGGPSRAVEAVDPGQIEIGPGDLLGLVANLPAAPELSVALQDCRAHLRITDRADSEKGFIVYRGLPGAAGLERIALLPANHDTLPMEWTDSVFFGAYTYSVAAFNQMGEAPSNPVILNVEAEACLIDSELAASIQPSSGGLRVENGELVLPQPVSMAYLYVSLNRGPWQRLPQAPSQFYTPGGDTIDLSHIVKTLQGDAADRRNHGVEVDIEVWGWQGGALINLGTLHHFIPPPTYLRMCSHVGSCEEGLGWEVDNQVRLPINELDGPWHFEYFAGDISGKTAVWQVSSMPFPPGPMLVSGVPTGSDDTGSQFFIDMQAISRQALDGEPFGQPAEGQDSFQTILSLLNAPAPLSLGEKYYVRVIPMVNNQVVGEPSNTIEVVIDPPLDPLEHDLYIPEAQEMIYEVNIVEFEPVHYPEPGVCQGAVVLDSDFIITNSLTGESDVLFPAGTVLCPELYKGVGEPAWYESLFDFVVGALGWISETWNSIKQAVVDVVGAVACGGNETCKDVLMAGLNMGLAALGIPPTIPNFDQLLEQGITALAGEVAGYLTNSPAVTELIKQAEEAGLTEEGEIQEWVRDRVADGLRAAVEQMREDGHVPCMSEEEAHAQGLEPLCLPPDVKGHLDPRGQRLPAYIEVEITRSSTVGLDYTREELGNYNLLIDAAADGLDEWLGQSFTEINGKRWTITGPLEGQALRTRLSVPYMAPGESVTLKLPLEPTEYWAAGHREVLDGWSYINCFDGTCQNLVVDDWQKLYYKSTLSISAAVSVCSDIQFDYLGSQCNYAVDTCEAGPMPYRDEPYQTFCK